MSPSERVISILRHMKEDCEDAIAFSRQVGSLEEFRSNKLIVKGVVMSIINIGELAKRLPDDYKSHNAEIPWRKITGMRDLAAHGYHAMEYGVIWSVAVESIPELLAFIDKQLAIDKEE